MKQPKTLLAVLLAVIMVFSLASCGTGPVQNTGSSEYRVAMITDTGDITDHSFNQTTYEAYAAYCKKMILVSPIKSRMEIRIMPGLP